MFDGIACLMETMCTIANNDPVALYLMPWY